MSNSSISVVIPYYMGEDYIEKCLLSLEQNFSRPLKVLVIDNCPRGFPARLLKSLYSNEVKVIKVKTGIGFGRACNIGIKFAIEEKSDFILLLNQDAWIQTGCIERLEAALAECSEAYVAAPLSLTYDAERISPHFFNIYISKYYEMLTDLFMGKLKNIYKVKFDRFNGSCVLMPIKKMEKVKYFDPLFYMYAEDRDLFLRAEENAFVCLVVPDARSAHMHSVASRLYDERAKVFLLIHSGMKILNLKRKHGFSFFISALKLLFPKKAFGLFLKGKWGLGTECLKLRFQVILNIRSILSHRDEKKLQAVAEIQIAKDCRDMRIVSSSARK